MNNYKQIFGNIITIDLNRSCSITDRYFSKDLPGLSIPANFFEADIKTIIEEDTSADKYCHIEATFEMIGKTIGTSRVEASEILKNTMNTMSNIVKKNNLTLADFHLPHEQSDEYYYDEYDKAYGINSLQMA